MNAVPPPDQQFPFFRPPVPFPNPNLRNSPFLPSDLAINPQFSVFTERNTCFLVGSVNNRAKRLCMEKKIEPENQEPAVLSVFDQSPSNLWTNQEEFGKVWEGVRKQFVDYPPAIFSDYRQVGKVSWKAINTSTPEGAKKAKKPFSGSPNVFTELREPANPRKISKSLDSAQIKKEKRKKTVIKKEKHRLSDPDEIQIVPPERPQTPELIEIDDDNADPEIFAPKSFESDSKAVTEPSVIDENAASATTEQSVVDDSARMAESPLEVEQVEPEDLEILENRFPESSPAVLEQIDLESIAKPSDMISLHFSAARAIKRGWESAKLPSGALKVGNSPKKSPSPSYLMTFTLCSYNVLCQSTIFDTMYLYQHCTAEDLDWNNRWAKLSKEFRLLDADIFCLQEVQAGHYDTVYRPFFEDLGYDGLFLKRTGAKEDGCASFWRRDKFDLEKSTPVVYYIPNTLLDRDNVGLIVTLIPKYHRSTTDQKSGSKKQKSTASSQRQKLVVANTHLLYNPKRGDIKLAQLALLLASLDGAAKCQPDWQGASSAHFPLILCGDFNAEPLSELYNFLMSGQLKYEGQNQYELSGQGKFGGRILDKRLIPPQAGVTDSCQSVNRWTEDREITRADSDSESSDDCLVVEDEELVSISGTKPKKKPKNLPPLSTGTLSHKFHFLSVYRHLTAKGDWEVTTQHSREAANVDYIFYGLKAKTAFLRDEQLVVKDVEEADLRCLQRYQLLSRKEMSKSVGKLPNKYCGSDHVPLMGKFELKM